MGLSGLKAQWNEKDDGSHGSLRISSELYKAGCVSSEEQGLEAARRIGFPVMIKASEGGGGKGIRKVECEDQFFNQYRQVGEGPLNRLWMSAVLNTLASFYLYRYVT